MWNYLEGNGWICKVGLENLVCWRVVVVWFVGGCLWLMFVVVVILFDDVCIFFGFECYDWFLLVVRRFGGRWFVGGFVFVGWEL